MNYYEHHLGDYDGATAHLSWIEDCAYRRLICLYYRSEAPLPADLKQICRLVRASSKQERDAVQQVLTEFFELRDDGWHQARCDADIARFKETEPERQARRENDAERQRRSRDRRRTLFEQLRRHDIIPPFDTKTHTLETLLSRVTGRDSSTDVTRDNTATQTPLPRHQTPVTKPTVGEAPQASPRASRLPPGWAPSEADIAFAANHGLVNGKAEAEASKFRDFWTAKSGKDATKLDWSATWRNWVRRAAEDRGTAPRRPPSDDPFAGAH